MTAPDRFLRLAFREGPAFEANRLIDEVRRQTQAEHGAAVNYEVVLTGQPADYLRTKVAPLLAFFLRSKRYRVSHCRPVFMTLFEGDRIYFVWAEAFFRELRISEGMSEDVFAELARVWEQSGRSALAALPPTPAGGDGRGGPGGDDGRGGKPS